MEIIGIDRLAYEPDRLNTFVGSRHSGIGEHRFGGARFVVLQLVSCFSLFIGAKSRLSAVAAFCSLVCRGLFAPSSLFLVLWWLWPFCRPRRPPDAVAQSSRNPLNPRLGEGTGADPIASDAAWSCYVPVYYYGWGLYFAFGVCIWITIPTSGNAPPWPEVICCRELKII